MKDNEDILPPPKPQKIRDYNALSAIRGGLTHYRNELLSEAKKEQDIDQQEALVRAASFVARALEEIR
jgi:hypothetical protein